MTLALLLSVCALFGAPASGSATPPDWQAAAQDAPAATPADTSTKPTDTVTPQSPPAPVPKAVSQSKPSAGTQSQPKGKKKKTSVAKCTDSAPASSNPAPVPSSGNTTAAAVPPTKCPPPVTVIHNGSTSDPAIKLTGGDPAAQASGKHSATDQLVGSTEENLKKIEGRQLSSSQQEMFTQIRQFLEQSKAALAAGDIDRGHNLALKARLLSDELAKP